MRALVRGIEVGAKAQVRKVLQTPFMRRVIERLATAAGARSTLTSPAEALFGEGVSAERRLLEVEAERDALAETIAGLKRKIDELERDGRH